MARNEKDIGFEKLHNTQQLFLKGGLRIPELILANMPIGVEFCEFDDEYTIVYANETFYSIIGYPTNKKINTRSIKHLNFVVPESVDKLNSIVRKSAEFGQCYSVKYQMKRYDGSIIWVMEYGSFITFQDNETYIQSGIVDIDEMEKIRIQLVHKNEELLLSNKRYEIIMQHSNDTAFMYIPDGKLIICNWQNKENFDFDSSNAMSLEQLFELGYVSSKSHNSLRNMLAKIDEGSAIVKGTVSINYNPIGNKESVCDIVITNVFYEVGQKRYAVGIIKDVTDRSMLKKERQYRDAIASNSLVSFEVNFTTNTVIGDFSDIAYSFGLNANDYPEFVTTNINENIHPNDREKFRKFSEKLYSRKMFLLGVSRHECEYRSKFPNGEHRWILCVVNTIVDADTHDIKGLVYVYDIHSKKTRELKMLEEQQFYERMISISEAVYEVNVSKDIFVKGHEYIYCMLEVEVSEYYSNFFQVIIPLFIHPNDLSDYRAKLSRENILKEYSLGVREIFCEYRQMEKDGHYVWCQSTIHLFEDPYSGDVKLYNYVKNIDNIKRRELKLLYKSEHDPLTELLNKGAVEECINDFLLSEDSRRNIHAFFIIDVDHFKLVNDNYGHVFGDVVLAQVASKLRLLFREEDVLGRIGGDEFVVLMKNIPNEKAAMVKTEEICNHMVQSFTKDDQTFQISVSIGIAFSNIHGTCYSQLYEHSDTALYAAKEKGRNGYVRFESGMISGMSSVRNIDINDFGEGKSFKDNASEYVFRILYESKDKSSAISAVLALLGKYYEIDLANIFEEYAPNSTMINTFTWINERTIVDNTSALTNTKISSIGYADFFNEADIYYLQNTASVVYKELFAPRNANSTLNFIIKNDKQPIGFLGFGKLNSSIKFSRKQLGEIRNIVNIISIFLVELREKFKKIEIKNTAFSIANSIEGYAYVVDTKNYNLIFTNDEFQKLYPNSKLFCKCYETIFDKSKICENCPIQLLKNSSFEKHVEQKFNDKNNTCLRINAFLIDWMDNKKACMICGLDLSQK